MRFLIYETLNKKNGKRYRGAHACTHVSCCYLGSGTLFKRALAKYGAESFERTVLAEASSIEEMFEEEVRLVDRLWVDDPNTYNLKLGGEGGWDYINRNKIRWTDEKRADWSRFMSSQHRVGVYKNFKPKEPTFRNKKHSDAAKQKMRQALQLDTESVSRRVREMVEAGYPRRGSTKVLSHLWGVSHTQVRRFCAGQINQVGDTTGANVHCVSPSSNKE